MSQLTLLTVKRLSGAIVRFHRLIRLTVTWSENTSQTRLQVGKRRGCRNICIENGTVFRVFNVKRWSGSVYNDANSVLQVNLLDLSRLTLRIAGTVFRGPSRIQTVRGNSLLNDSWATRQKRSFRENASVIQTIKLTGNRITPKKTMSIKIMLWRILWTM